MIRSPFRLVRLTCIAGLLAVAGCSKQGSGPVVVSVAGTDAQLSEPLKDPLSPASKLILEATAQGLVAFDASGDIVPALAQRWIVEDDGRSYIFRLRRAEWPDGTKIDAKEVARLLDARIRANRALDPLGDLDAVTEVVPMTGEVIEIRLGTPRPYLLQMLAQPQMAIMRLAGGTGPYREATRPGALFLSPVPEPAADPAAGEEDRAQPWQNRVLRAERPAKGIARFRMGLADLMLGGRFFSLPLLGKSGVDTQAVRLDPVQGLFGLAITGEDDFFGDPEVREALTMAVDRDRLPGAFDLGGWVTATGIVPQQFDLPAPPVPPRWADWPIDDRRAEAANAIRRWAAAHGGVIPTVRIAMPRGAGSRVLYGLIARDFRRIGVASRLVGPNEDADLRLIDEVAAYDSALWYLGRVSCARKLRCNAAAEEKLKEAGLADSNDARSALLAQAQALMAADSGYIPLAMPVRWSLVSPRLTGFLPSRRARHPLNHLFRATN
jgi:oligopeptide transport system substrate-binding protein